MTAAWFWIPATLAASAAQTARNVMQRRLTETIGTIGATQVRFLFGLPFALLFLPFVAVLSGERPPGPGGDFLAFVLLGAVTQILATGLMLAAMRERAFSLVTAYIKTEPVQVALFGLVVLGERLPPLAFLAIVIATSGVVLTSLKPGGTNLSLLSARPVLLGVTAGAFFALASVGFRGAILALDHGSFLIRATTTLAVGLGLQTALLMGWLALFDRPALIGSFRAWRESLFAGFLGALASQFWFIGFALTSAANVRTLALVEVVFAAAVSHRLLSQRTSAREIAGMALVVVGVALLLVSQVPSGG